MPQEHPHFKLNLLFKKVNISKHQLQDTKIIWQLSYLPRNDKNIDLFFSNLKWISTQTYLLNESHPNTISKLLKLYKEGWVKGMNFGKEVGKRDEFFSSVPVHISTLKKSDTRSYSETHLNLWYEREMNSLINYKVAILKGKYEKKQVCWFFSLHV